MMELRTITREEFDKITCNRCGVCCEGFYLPSPLELASGNDRDPKWASWISDIEPTGKIVKGYGDFKGISTYQYRCTRFKRDDNGLGVCTKYDERPLTCSEFPYGRPISTSEAADGWEKCSWAGIKVEGEE